MACIAQCLLAPLVQNEHLWFSMSIETYNQYMFWSRYEAEYKISLDS